MYTRREYHTDYSYPIKLAALTHTSLWIVNWITPTQERSRTSSMSTDRYDVYSVTHRFLPRCWLWSLITNTDPLICSLAPRGIRIETRRLFSAKRWQYWIVFSLIVCQGKWCHKHTIRMMFKIRTKTIEFNGSLEIRIETTQICHFRLVAFCYTCRDQLEFELEFELKRGFTVIYIRK